MYRFRLVLKFIALPVVLTLIFGACANDGRDLADARDWQTTTTRPPPPTSAPPQGISESGLTLSSPDFAPAGVAPALVRCDGSNFFPTLQFANVPSDAVELAVTLSDQTDPEKPILLWLMGGLSPDRTELPSGVLPNGAYETLNDYGQLGWGNPCLESLAAGSRDLQFKVYVMTRVPAIAAGDPGNEAWDTLAASAVDNATLLMTIDATG